MKVKIMTYYVKMILGHRGQDNKSVCNLHLVFLFLIVRFCSVCFWQKWASILISAFTLNASFILLRKKKIFFKSFISPHLLANVQKLKMWITVT